MNDYQSLKASSAFINPGSFSDYGGWALDTQFIPIMGGEYLLAHGLGAPVADAVTEADFPGPGCYRVWVYTKDWVARWKNSVAPGLFRAVVGGRELDPVFGREGAEWGWRDGGVVEIGGRRAAVALRDLTGFEGRCAGLFFTRELGFTPPDGIEDFTKLRRAVTGREGAAFLGKYDLLVAGGGIAGMCAAVSAARNGLKTALVHDRDVLAGNNSSEVRVWLGGETNYEPFPRVGDVVREFEQEKTGHYGPVNTAGIYEDGKKMAILRREPNLDLFMGHFLTGARTDGGFIQSAELYNVRTGAYGVIEAGLFADCTGDGNLGAFAGADYETTTNGHMGMSNLWHIEETDAPQPFPRCPWAIDLSKADFPGRKGTDCVYGWGGPEALGAWFWESGMEHDPIAMAEYARDTNFRAMYGAFDCLKNTDNDYVYFRLKFAAYIGGRRESRRLLGDIVLTKSEVFARKAFPDGVVPSTWNFDVHYPDRRFYPAFHEGDGFLTKDYHEDFPKPFFIPYRCLYSRNIRNLFMAGRDVSVSHDALGTVRVMRTGGMMGEVVGAAAAICVERGAEPRDVYGKYLAELFARLGKTGE